MTVASPARRVLSRRLMHDVVTDHLRLNSAPLRSRTLLSSATLPATAPIARTARKVLCTRRPSSSPSSRRHSSHLRATWRRSHLEGVEMWLRDPLLPSLIALLAYEPEGRKCQTGSGFPLSSE
jgi:hypothetical protein